MKRHRLRRPGLTTRRRGRSGRPRTRDATLGGSRETPDRRPGRHPRIAERPRRRTPRVCPRARPRRRRHRRQSPALCICRPSPLTEPCAPCYAGRGIQQYRNWALGRKRVSGSTFFSQRTRLVCLVCCRGLEADGPRSRPLRRWNPTLRAKPTLMFSSTWSFIKVRCNHRRSGRQELLIARISLGPTPTLVRRFVSFRLVSSRRHSSPSPAHAAILFTFTLAAARW